MVTTENIIWFLLIIIVVLLLCSIRENLIDIFAWVTVAISAIVGIFKNDKNGSNDDISRDDEGDLAREEINGARETAEISITGSSDVLRDYLRGTGEISDISHDNKIDAKKLTSASLKSASNKQVAMESFVDKLVSNSVLFLRSLETKPTDIALAQLNKNKTLLTSAADLLEKKYADSRISPTDLRELARKIAALKTSEYADKLEKYGDISREELAARFVALKSQKESASLDTCQRDLRVAEDTKARMMGDNDELRKNNERLREEIRRGLTNYNCEALLRECRDEKDRLSARLRDAGDAGDKNRADALQREVIDLRSVIRAMQEEEQKTANLHEKYKTEINKLTQDVQECGELVNQILNESDKK